ncbi:uncharacterized protein STEHIDRAFT_127755 [Stereum hirsutum FP-91666 SS1]|uniref:uncharacterized protein n=1 Tax=Stereum hirsutum (strain FP-91666) TaxID=721885 RepID=UPI000440CB01|nr:uncharacterized protein STEHIDRAFT_127755 [Stereum hirsutum FP-91666 SS1]EIM90626.1 hypothetical protein STEHIDRAFT_127755 [Stereum hirsutum FP-91666 SS1]
MPVPATSTSSPTSRKPKSSRRSKRRSKLTPSTSDSRKTAEREIISLDSEHPASESSDSFNTERTSTFTDRTLPLGAYVGLALRSHDNHQNDFERHIVNHPIEEFQMHRSRGCHARKEDTESGVVETGYSGAIRRSLERGESPEKGRTSSSEGHDPYSPDTSLSVVPVAIPISSSQPVITSPPVSAVSECPSIHGSNHDGTEDVTVPIQNILEHTIQPSLGDLFRDRSASPPLGRHHESIQEHEGIPKKTKEIESTPSCPHVPRNAQDASSGQVDGEASSKHDLANGFTPTSFETLFRGISIVSGEPGPEDTPAENEKDVMSLRNPDEDGYTLEEKTQHAATSGSGEVKDSRSVDNHGEIAVNNSTGQGEEVVDARNEADNSSPPARLFKKHVSDSSLFRTQTSPLDIPSTSPHPRSTNLRHSYPPQRRINRDVDDSHEDRPSSSENSAITAILSWAPEERDGANLDTATSTLYEVAHLVGPPQPGALANSDEHHRERPTGSPSVLEYLVTSRMHDLEERIRAQDETMRDLRDEVVALRNEAAALRHEAAALNGTIIALTERDRFWAATMSRPMEMWCQVCGTHSIGARWNGQGLGYMAQ